MDEAGQWPDNQADVVDHQAGYQPRPEHLPLSEHLLELEVVLPQDWTDLDGCWPQTVRVTTKERATANITVCSFA